MNLTIIADNRERASGILVLLAEKGVRVMMKQMAVGDYMIDGDMVIERKKSTDFVQSILTKIVMFIFVLKRNYKWFVMGQV
ncbi:MAG: hypothetical protein COW63_15565 [Bacteroidetes bacterium CG18_big_fil_WC_8_21_14_2_50_41_14]|nr:MAG: hypothetical protein COW63_15565 [Bacteroidetes bacterium CG18_big_fil_WC_8_21_14_2_50_41_14]PIY31987.1 MAG: hypothetical protein COZ08_07900 [Bacteroidetes bacterium CG_4_10_14_3_um_filter_42_6]